MLEQNSIGKPLILTLMTTPLAVYSNFDEADDEEADLHQCGHCKQMFTSLTRYITHKLERSCLVDESPTHWTADKLAISAEEHSHENNRVTADTRKYDQVVAEPNGSNQDLQKRKHDRKGTARRLNVTGSPVTSEESGEERESRESSNNDNSISSPENETQDTPVVVLQDESQSIQTSEALEKTLSEKSQSDTSVQPRTSTVVTSRTRIPSFAEQFTERHEIDRTRQSPDRRPGRTSPFSGWGRPVRDRSNPQVARDKLSDVVFNEPVVTWSHRGPPVSTSSGLYPPPSHLTRDIYDRHATPSLYSSYTRSSHYSGAYTQFPNMEYSSTREFSRDSGTHSLVPPHYTGIRHMLGESARQIPPEMYGFNRHDVNVNFSPRETSERMDRSPRQPPSPRSLAYSTRGSEHPLETRPRHVSENQGDVNAAGPQEDATIQIVSQSTPVEESRATQSSTDRATLIKDPAEESPAIGNERRSPPPTQSPTGSVKSTIGSTPPPPQLVRIESLNAPDSNSTPPRTKRDGSDPMRPSSLSTRTSSLSGSPMSSSNPSVEQKSGQSSPSPMDPDRSFSSSLMTNRLNDMMHPDIRPTSIALIPENRRARTPPPRLPSQESYSGFPHPQAMDRVMIPPSLPHSEVQSGKDGQGIPPPNSQGQRPRSAETAFSPTGEVSQVPASDDVLLNDPSWRHSKQVYRCPLCAKIFPFKSKLQRHVLVHTGIKPYKCNVCGRGFTQQIDLQRHATRHTGEKPFKCHLCNAQFIRADNLRKHAKDTHYVSIEEPIRKRRRKTMGSDNVLPPLEVAIAMAISETEKNGGRVLGRTGNRVNRAPRRPQDGGREMEHFDQSAESFARPTMGPLPSHPFPMGVPPMGLRGGPLPPVMPYPGPKPHYSRDPHINDPSPPRMPHSPPRMHLSPPRLHPNSMVFHGRPDPGRSPPDINLERHFERPFGFGRPADDAGGYWKSPLRRTPVSPEETPSFVEDLRVKAERRDSELSDSGLGALRNQETSEISNPSSSPVPRYNMEVVDEEKPEVVINEDSPPSEALQSGPQMDEQEVTDNSIDIIRQDM